MEESKEFLHKLENGETKELPLFTSCCPAWVRYCETKHPELMGAVSTCKSPMQMFSSVIKEHFKSRDEVEGMKTVMISIMPCTAKKAEAAREEFVHDGRADTDLVITTSELVQMIKEAGLQFAEIEPESPDMPFSLFSGAGVIFGVTGGVTEAVIRRVMDDKSQTALKSLEFIGVRGKDGIKVCEVPLGDTTLRIAVVSGLNNAETIISKIKAAKNTSTL